MAVFGRAIPDSFSSIEEDVETLLAGVCAVERAIAENVALDDRVSPDRANPFFVRCVDRGLPVLEALNEQQTSCGVELYDSTLNSNNFVFCPQVLTAPKLPIGTRLVTVVRIFPAFANALKTVYWNQRINEIGDDLDGSIDNPLDSLMGHPEGIAKIKKLVATAHRLVRQIRERDHSKQYSWQNERIVWVATEQDFAPHLAGGPKRWLEILGIGNLLDAAVYDRSVADDWFVLLNYEMSRTNGLSRPTVFEAGGYAWHFPTPANWQVEQGGRTVILGASSDAGIAPLKEFVHTTRRIAEQDVCEVSRFRPDPIDSPVLNSCRERHRAWMAVQQLQ